VSKQSGIRAVIPPGELAEWVQHQAEDIGCDAATWIRMLVVAARKQGRAAIPTPRVPVLASPAGSGLQYADNQEDAWRGPVEDEPAGEASEAEIAAMIEGKLAEADAQGMTASAAEPVEMFASRPPAPGAGSTWALRAPPPRYSAGSQPAHLRAL